MPTSDVMLRPPAPEATPPIPHEVAPSPRYWAFLSYSHRDRLEADKLHKRLEAYRLPSDLVGTETRAGRVPPRLRPVFRDREELTASADLGEEVKRALSESRSLLVLCSPAAAVSRWANAEIALFRRVNPDAPVLAAIIAGEPWASEIPGREAEECFPLALRRRYDKRGRMTSARAEPIAADLRPEGDGPTLGKLKLVAGMLGLPLDRLARREERRQRRRLTWIAAAGVVGTVATGGLAVAAVDARDEAQDQREAAEGLVEFMLKDLRAKLEPVGRLDALDSVGARTLAYFEAQDSGELSDGALGQRARALLLIGEVANLRGDLDVALRRFREAERSTAEALARAPDDPRRMFDHAQSVFWTGAVAQQRGDVRQAGDKLTEYKRLADAMVAAGPDEPKYRLEQAYANTNLGVLWQEQRQSGRALPYFAGAVDAFEALVRARPGDRAPLVDRLEAYAWRAQARQDTGALEAAVQDRMRVLGLVGAMDPDGRDMAVQAKSVVSHLALSDLHLWRGDVPLSLAHARAATAGARALRRIEPGNAKSVEGLALGATQTARALLLSGQVAEAAGSVEEGCAAAEQLVAREPQSPFWRVRVLVPCMLERAQVVAAQGATPSALALAGRALGTARANAPGPERQRALARAHGLLGTLADDGDPALAGRHWGAALSAMPPAAGDNPLDQAVRMALLRRLGRDEEAAAIARSLRRMGFNHPRFRVV